MVHEDDIIPVFPHKTDRLRPALRLREGKRILFQKALGDLAVDHIVVHHEHVYIGGCEGLHAPQLNLGELRHLRGGAPVHDLLGDGDGKRGPLSVDALHADGPPHQLHQMLHDSQPQTGALHAPVPLGVHLAEILEDLLQILLPDAAAGVLNAEGDQLLILLFAGLAGDVGPHIALLCEFNGVIEDIDQDLLDPPLVAVVAAGKGAVARIFHNQPALGGGHVHHAHHLIHNRLQVVVCVYQLHLAGLHLGQV